MLLLNWTGCTRVESYIVKDPASGAVITFPGFPYTRAHTASPYRHLTELRSDSMACWFTVTSRPRDLPTQIREGSRKELAYQMNKQGFELAREADTSAFGYPAYLAVYHTENNRLCHFMVYKDTFIVHASVLLVSPEIRHRADAYLSSLNFNS